MHVCLSVGWLTVLELLLLSNKDNDTFLIGLNERVLATHLVYNKHSLHLIFTDLIFLLCF